MRRGYLPVIISVEQRLQYYDALDTAHTRGDYAPFYWLGGRLGASDAEKIFTGNFG